MTDRGRQRLKDTLYVVVQTLVIIATLLAFMRGYINLRIDNVEADVIEMKKITPNSKVIEIQFKHILEALTKIDKQIENCQEENRKLREKFLE